MYSTFGEANSVLQHHAVADSKPQLRPLTILYHHRTRSRDGQSVHIDELIQALSGQLLVQYFTQNTLLDLLGKSRETFAKQFQTALQKQLDHFSTGVEGWQPPADLRNGWSGRTRCAARPGLDTARDRGARVRSVRLRGVCRKLEVTLGGNPSLRERQDRLQF